MSFASPYFLIALLLVPLVLGLAIWFDRRRARYAVAFTNLDLLASVVAKRRRPWRRWIPLALFLLALAAASTALARPRAKVSVTSSQATVVLLVDVSGSMRANDVKPTRLGAAQHAMAIFSDKVPRKVRIGLVSFSTGPDVLVSPTVDRGVLQEGIDLLRPRRGRRSVTAWAWRFRSSSHRSRMRRAARTGSCPVRSSCCRTALRPEAF